MNALTSAIECLRDIASMGQKAGSETARNWLIAHGYAREAGGYVPGRGFEDMPEMCTHDDATFCTDECRAKEHRFLQWVMRDSVGVDANGSEVAEFPHEVAT